MESSAAKLGQGEWQAGKTHPKSKRQAEEVESAEASWIDQEAGAGNFANVRLELRFKTLVEQISGCVGGSIPFACQDWAAAKAAYRFFSNPRLSEADILGGQNLHHTHGELKA